MSYRPYKELSTEKIKANLSTLRYQLKNLKPSNSGQASNYYAPAIHYHEDELRRRGVEV